MTESLDGGNPTSGKATYEHPMALLPTALIRDPKISGNAKLIYAAIGTHTPNPFPSQALLASYLGMSVSTVKRALKEIQEAGWVRVQYRYDKKGRRSSNGYVLLHGKKKVRSGRRTDFPSSAVH